jgi:spore germination protein GerM
VSRSTGSGDTASYAFKALIRGPTSTEEGRDFIDSFPSKPKLLGVKKHNEVITLNFDSSFGRGVSFQTLRYQLRQLYEQAKHTQGAKGISIHIHGKHQKTLSGDGITIPKIINDSFFNAG